MIQHRVLRDRVGNGYVSYFIFQKKNCFTTLFWCHFMQGSWHRALRFKVKFERSKIEDVGVVQENRKKFGRKHAESDTCNDDNNNCAKRISRRVNDFLFIYLVSLNGKTLVAAKLMLC